MILPTATHRLRQISSIFTAPSEGGWEVADVAYSQNPAPLQKIEAP